MQRRALGSNLVRFGARGRIFLFHLFDLWDVSVHNQTEDVNAAGRAELMMLFSAHPDELITLQPAL